MRLGRVLLFLGVLAAVGLFFLPGLLSTGPGRRLALWWLNRQIAGRVEVTEWSLGWWTGVRADGITVFDPEGVAALRADRLEAHDIRLLSLASRYPHFGRVRVSGLVVRSRRLADGRGNLPAALTPPAPPRPRPAVTEPAAPASETAAPAAPAAPEPPPFDVSVRLILEDGGRLLAEPVPGAEPIAVTLLRADVDIPSLTREARYRLSVSAPRGGRPGLVDLDGAGRLLKDGDIDWDGLVLRLTGRIDRLDLAVVSDVVRSAGGDFGLSGTLDSIFSIDNAGSIPTAEGTEIRLRDFALWRHAQPAARLTLEDGTLSWQERFRLSGTALTDPEGRVAARLDSLVGREVDLVSLVSSRWRLGSLKAEGLTVRSRRLADGRNNLAAAIREPEPEIGPGTAAPAGRAAVPGGNTMNADAAGAESAPPATHPSTGNGLPIDVSGDVQLDGGLLIAEGGAGAASDPPDRSAELRDVRFRLAVESLRRPADYALSAKAWVGRGPSARPGGDIDLRGRPTFLDAGGRFNLDGLLGGHRGGVRGLDLAVASAVVAGFDPDWSLSGTVTAELRLSSPERADARRLPGTLRIEGRDLLVTRAGEVAYRDAEAELTVRFLADPAAGTSEVLAAEYRSARMGTLKTPLVIGRTTLSGLYGRVFTADGVDPYAMLADASLSASLGEWVAYLNPLLRNRSGAAAGRLDVRFERARGFGLGLGPGTGLASRGEAELSVRLSDLRPERGTLGSLLFSAAQSALRRAPGSPAAPAGGPATGSASTGWERVVVRGGKVLLGRQVWRLDEGPAGTLEVVFTGDIDLSDGRLNVDVELPNPGGPPDVIPLRGTVDDPHLAAADAARVARRVLVAWVRSGGLGGTLGQWALGVLEGRLGGPTRFPLPPAGRCR
jgi:hypothetical protein